MTRESNACLPPNTGRWLNGCNVYSCSFWPQCILCCMTIHPRHGCDPSHALLMDIHALPQLRWTHTYFILLLKRNDEFLWPWIYSGRCSIGETAKGVQRSWVAARFTHHPAKRREERMKRHGITWQIKVLWNGKISEEWHGCYSTSLEQDEWISFFFPPLRVFCDKTFNQK